MGRSDMPIQVTARAESPRAFTNKIPCTKMNSTDMCSQTRILSKPSIATIDFTSKLTLTIVDGSDMC